MPMLTIPKQSLQPRENLPAGFVQLEFKGFKPGLTKKKDSVNLNPVLNVINDARSDSTGKPLNGQRVFDYLNVNFMQRVVDFFHAFGADLIDNGAGLTIPGEWSGDPSNPDPTKWGDYVSGPLLPNGRGNVGAIATAELAETSYQEKPGADIRHRTEVKRYICQVPNCDVKHSESLIR